MQDIFTTALGTTETSYTLEKVKEALETLNTERKEQLPLLLEYIEDKGESVNNGVKYGTRVIGAHKVPELIANHHKNSSQRWRENVYSRR